jgi:ATP-binding cassette subfamily F protein 3
MNEVIFGYTPEKIILKGVNIDVGLDSRIAIVGANGAGKSTLYVLGSLLPFHLNIFAESKSSLGS